MTATEAFLRSAHIDHGDPPLPHADDADVGARYARDAMRATARARTRRDEETLEVLPERDTEHRPGRNGKSSPDERATTDARTTRRPGCRRVGQAARVAVPLLVLAGRHGGLADQVSVRRRRRVTTPIRSR